MSKTIATLPEFIATLKTAGAAPIQFQSNAGTIQAGFHVTELKHATVTGIDCGGNVDSWQETVVQLLDGSGVGGYMSAEKFIAIAERSIAKIPALANGKLRFEFAPNNGPAQIFDGAVPSDQDGLHLALVTSHATCKPAAAVGGTCGTGGCCDSPKVA